VCYDSDQDADPERKDLRLPALWARVGQARGGEACPLPEMQNALLERARGQLADGAPEAKEVSEMSTWGLIVLVLVIALVFGDLNRHGLL
jgi:hypothetical protein